MTALNLFGVSKRFDDVIALDELSFNVEPGEFFALLGPSASGKTTTLRTIAGIERPDTGKVIFDGHPITDPATQGRTTAMVFQSFALYPHLTVYDNLAYPLRERGEDTDAVSRRVGETAEQLRLSHTLARKPGTLSGGEQQRVAIGRALIRRPRLLLLDEPLTNLDAKLRHDTRAEFKRLHRELGMTVVYATPDELEALSMGQRIGVLQAGRMLQIGTPDDLYLRPNSAEAARMVGSPTMNLIEGVTAAGGKQGTVALPFMDAALNQTDLPMQDLQPGAELLLGLRPHDLFPVVGDPQGPHFDATVQLTEPHGDTTIVDLSAGLVPLKMVLPESGAVNLRRGDLLRIGFDPGRVHLFHRETGTAIA